VTYDALFTSGGMVAGNLSERFDRPPDAGPGGSAPRRLRPDVAVTAC